MPESTKAGDFFLPWAQLDQLSTPSQDDFLSKQRQGEDVSICIIREGDVETTYQVLVPPRITVAELKKAVTAQTGGLIPVAVQEFRRSEGQTFALKDEEILCCFENEILVLRTVVAQSSDGVGGMNAAGTESGSQGRRKKQVGRCSVM
ncbi:unnamed protein product [Amoebophrya sp. A25]|nr:unnamed protein product [Amoebophrya sp. A25]|eukprot:GSA25T00012369001.1